MGRRRKNSWESTGNEMGNSQSGWIIKVWIIQEDARACLKNHSYHLHAPLCVILVPNSGYIARYAPFIWHKSPTNCDAHLAESIFQIRSRRKAALY